MIGHCFHESRRPLRGAQPPGFASPKSSRFFPLENRELCFIALLKWKPSHPRLYSKWNLGLHQHRLRKLYQVTCRPEFPSEGMPLERKVAIGGIETVRVEGMTSVVVGKVNNNKEQSHVKCRLTLTNTRDKSSMKPSQDYSIDFLTLASYPLNPVP